MFNNNCNCNSSIEGVSCSVSECKYHDGARSCTASCICVENKSQEDGIKTTCSTFEKK